jgi:hypothetical protein
MMSAPPLGLCLPDEEGYVSRVEVVLVIAIESCES